MPRSTALALLGGAVLATARAAGAQTAPATVRIGTMSIDPFGETYFGVDQGIYRNNGIDAQLSTLPNGSTIVQSVLGGDLDVGLANIVTVAAAVAKGIPLLMIAPAALYSAKHSYSRLCVAKNSPFKTAKDLDGAAIAVSSLNDFNQLGVAAWLEHNGIAPSKVHFVELKFPEMGAALQRGTVQAATIAEPALSSAIHAGEARAFADVYEVIAPEFANIVWFTSKSWLQKNPDAAKRLVSSIYATARWANEHQAQSAEILAKASKMDPTVVATMTRAYFATSSNPKYVRAPLDFASRYGLISRPVTTAEFIAP
ncbi:MAG TPA: ABC transporter substrate-binding protein [Candidatus Aquilonibacter sp.]